MSLEEQEQSKQRKDFIAAVEQGVRAAVEGELRPHAEAVQILKHFGSSDDER